MRDKLHILGGRLNGLFEETLISRRLELTNAEGKLMGEIIFARARWENFGREELIKIIYAANCSRDALDREEGFLIKATPHLYADHTICDKVLETQDWDWSPRLELCRGTLETLSVPYAEREGASIEWKHVARLGLFDIYWGVRNIYIERPDCIDGDLYGVQSYLGVEIRDFCGLCPIGATHLYDTDPL